MEIIYTHISIFVYIFSINRTPLNDTYTSITMSVSVSYQ